MNAKLPGQLCNPVMAKNLGAKDKKRPLAARKHCNRYRLHAREQERGGEDDQVILFLPTIEIEGDVAFWSIPP